MISPSKTMSYSGYTLVLMKIKNDISIFKSPRYDYYFVLITYN